MTAAPRHPDLHELVDRLNPVQADAVRAVVIQLVSSDDADPAPAEGGQTPPARRLSFVGAGASKDGITSHIDDLMANGFGRE